MIVKITLLIHGNLEHIIYTKTHAPREGDLNLKQQKLQESVFIKLTKLSKNILTVEMKLREADEDKLVFQGDTWGVFANVIRTGEPFEIHLAEKY